MKIIVANLTLRFYSRDDWTFEKVKGYLVNKKHKVVYRRDDLFPELSYFAVYDDSGHKVFKRELLEHEFDNKHNIDYKGWHINA